MPSTQPLWLAIGLVACLAPRSALAEQVVTPPDTPNVGAFQLPSASRRSPYRNLFGPPVARRVDEPRTADTRTGQLPAVVCGMTILPADPAVDPKMLKTMPPADTRHTIRSIPPPVCR